MPSYGMTVTPAQEKMLREAGFEFQVWNAEDFLVRGEDPEIEFETLEDRDLAKRYIRERS